MHVGPPVLDDKPVSADELSFLRVSDPTAVSPYRSVYPEGGGWQARCFKRRVGEVQPNPRDAAKLVVRWWRGRYGPRWRAVFHYRQTAGWVVRKTTGGWWGVAHLAAGGVVFVGQVDGVACVAAGSPGCRPFASRKGAAAGVRAWAVSRWGREAGYHLRRCWTPTHSAGRTPVPLPG